MKPENLKIELEEKELLEKSIGILFPKIDKLRKETLDLILETVYKSGVNRGVGYALDIIKKHGRN